MKRCACGCGQPTLRAYDHGVRKGEYHIYLHGHQCRGIPKSFEHRQKLSESRKANPTKYWLGKKMPESARAAMRGPRQPLSLEHRQKISESERKFLRDPIERAKRATWVGRYHTLATREKMSLAQKGEKGSGWKGGVSSLNERIRVSSQFRQWRSAVFVRDNYTCQRCGEKRQPGVTLKLHPHHIKPFARYLELRFDVSNGVTLCKQCHGEVHKNHDELYICS